jgi:hypothetical protein
MKKIVLLVLLGSMALATAWADKTVKADDPQVSYTGRVQKSGDGSVRYDWVGTYWQTDFTGGRIAINVSEKGESYHNVFIDGQLVRKIRITGSESHRVVLADRLGKGTHRLMLQKCTEGEYGCVTLQASRWPTAHACRPCLPAIASSRSTATHTPAATAPRA